MVHWLPSDHFLFRENVKEKRLNVIVHRFVIEKEFAKETQELAVELGGFYNVSL